MKGLMVTLLIFLTTGIVVGQQTDTGQFPFGDRSSGASAPGSSRNANNFTPTREDISEVKPFDLSVDDEGYRGFVNGKPLWSPIRQDDRNLSAVVNAITLSHVDYFNNKATGIHKIYGEDAGGGEIHFMLNDFDVKNLNEGKKLVYELKDSERGQYDAVRFFFKGASQANNQPQSVFNNQQTSGPAPDNNPAIPNRQSNASVFIPPPGPESLPGEVEFVGPYIPQRTQQVAQINQETSFPPRQTNPFTSPVDLDAIRQRQALQRLADQRLADRQESERLARINSGTSQWRIPDTQSNQPTAQQLADWQRQNQLDAAEAELTARAQNLVEQEEAIKKAQRQLDYQNYIAGLKTTGPSDITPSQSQYIRPMGPTQGIDYPPRQPVIERSPLERLASNDPDRFNSGRDIVMQQNAGRGLRGLQPEDFNASINGPLKSDVGNRNASTTGLLEKTATELKKDSRAEGFIYFMLLCSLGLNVYLMLISRGFYVRYNELADELRETFTATM